MKNIFIFIIAFVLGSYVTYYYINKNPKESEQEQAQIVIAQIRSLKNLIVTEGVFSETYSYKNTKNYLYDFFQFEKKAVLIVNAKVQVSYNLGLLETKIDTVNKTIYIKKIPEPTVEIIPDIKYFDMQQSAFNTFSKDDLNKAQEQAIKHIEVTSEVAKIKERAKTDLIKELQKIYFLTNAMHWKLVDETDLELHKQLKN